jgi:hypothetical protein
MFMQIQDPNGVVELTKIAKKQPPLSALAVVVFIVVATSSEFIIRRIGWQ